MASRALSDVSTRVSILAADDLPSNLIAIEAIVDALGHDLVAVPTGLEALEAATTHEFAAILLDVSMPGLDGFQTLKRLREIPGARATPVIFLTAYRFDPAMIRRAYELGAVDYLEKPIANELLSGKLSSFIALFQQRKEIARQEEVLRIKDRHIGILAHDLRSPLATALQGARQLERHEDLTVRIVADRIARAARELSQLTNDLLASARTATAVPLKPESVELSSLVEELVDDFRATHGTVRFSTAFSCHIVGFWDPSRIRQALSNLLCNAVKYGTGLVVVETRSERERACVVIENSGQALSALQLAQLNTPLPASDSPKSEAGLGLVVAREIALAHGGELRAESDRRGTRFILQLPQRVPA